MRKVYLKALGTQSQIPLYNKILCQIPNNTLLLYRIPNVRNSKIKNSLNKNIKCTQLCYHCFLVQCYLERKQL